MILSRLLILTCVGTALAQYHPTTTPVPILKQINRHNEDGSYSYGFEAADGSYKIESKYPTGEVYGKYGFIDDTGSVREVEYGATRRGFEPIGTGINVPPPTVSGNSIGPNEPEDDGQYREDPSIYYTDPKYTNGETYDPVPKIPAVYQNYKVPTYKQAGKSIVAAYRQPLAPQQEYQPQQQQYRMLHQSEIQASQHRPQYYPNNPIIKRYDYNPDYNLDHSNPYRRY